MGISRDLSVGICLWGSPEISGIYGDLLGITKKEKKQRRKEELMTFVTTRLNKEIITLFLNGLQCVCV
jgi:hypothetical protein